jgi:hypothetical protein
VGISPAARTECRLDSRFLRSRMSDSRCRTRSGGFGQLRCGQWARACSSSTMAVSPLALSRLRRTARRRRGASPSRRAIVLATRELRLLPATALRHVSRCDIRSRDTAASRIAPSTIRLTSAGWPIRSSPLDTLPITRAPSRAAVTRPRPPKETRPTDHRGGDDLEHKVPAAGLGGGRALAGDGEQPSARPSPSRIRWSPATVASWPVTGTRPARPCAFSAAMTPPAIPSFATSTPSMWSFDRVRAGRSPVGRHRAHQRTLHE